jgi:glycosyltransferase involved in cell wall biosynthesis
MTDRLLLILIPAFNEGAAVGSVIESVRATMPGVPVLVVDDCSLDDTVSAAKTAGAEVLSLPHHLGLGGAVQAGYKLAFELGFQYVIRVDGDGQHEARHSHIRNAAATGVEMVIGLRHMNGNGNTSIVRSIGILFFRMVLRPILGKDVRDPTSGFVGVNRSALQVFSHSFPLEYPEIEALVVLQRKAFRFQEISCRFHPRKTGKSSITPLKSIYYIVHVLLGVFVNVLRRGLG